MSELALPRLDSGWAAHQSDTVPYLNLEVSDDIPTNEYGIVVLENPQPCMGEDCPVRRDEEECFIDLDHLHHSEAYYDYNGSLAIEFRSQAALTRWVFRCVHNVKHSQYPHNVPIPRPQVMKQAIAEARLLHEIEVNYRNRTSLANVLERPDLRQWYRRAVRVNLDKHMKDKKKLVRSVDSIEFLPQEIVTGALLLASPGHAENRLIADPSYMLPGTIRRHEVRAAWQAANEMLARREENGRALVMGSQLDQEYIEAMARAA